MTEQEKIEYIKETASIAGLSRAIKVVADSHGLVDCVSADKQIQHLKIFALNHRETGSMYYTSRLTTKYGIRQQAIMLAKRNKRNR